MPVKISGGGSTTDTRSWNLGKLVLATPLETTSCSTTTPITSDSGYNDANDSARVGDQVANVCNNVVDVKLFYFS